MGVGVEDMCHHIADGALPVWHVCAGIDAAVPADDELGDAKTKAIKMNLIRVFQNKFQMPIRVRHRARCMFSAERALAGAWCHLGGVQCSPERDPQVSAMAAAFINFHDASLFGLVFRSTFGTSPAIVIDEITYCLARTICA